MTPNDPSSTRRLPSYDNEDRARLSQRLRPVLLAVFIACAVVLPVTLWMANGQGLWTALAGLVVAGLAHLLNRRDRVDEAVFVLLLGMLLAISTSMIAGEGVHDSGMILYPTILIVGSLLLSPRTYRLIVSLVVASVGFVWWLSASGHIAPAFRSITAIDDLLSIVTVLLVQAVAADVLARGLHRNLDEARRENIERRSAEAEVRRLNAELEQRVEIRTAELAVANADLESFSYSVSHDLRTPLRVASNYATILDQEFAGVWDPEARQLLERILASNARMNSLIDELLRFSRLGRRDVMKRRVDMEAVARGVIDLLATGSPDREVDWVVHGLPPVQADPLLMEQVYANLIGNAFKYTGRRGRARIEVGFDEDGGEASYFVRDDGVGFDMRHADKLFGVFERLHRDDEFEGTGIGLATVQRILAKHGGRIWASSEPGVGSTFRFQLPPV